MTNKSPQQGIASAMPGDPEYTGGKEHSRQIPHWLETLLRVPLVAKIAGANAIIVVAALVTGFSVVDGNSASAELMVVMAVALAGGLVINVALVLIALRPLDDLETTAQRIWRGDLEARVPRSLVADRDMLRIGGALNVLLDGLTADRTKLRAMASQVLQAGDAERARIARELHDSSAQTLAGLLLELSALDSANRDPQLKERLDRVRRISAGVLDELKMLAHTVHPRVLEDRGLVAALEHLARETQLRSQVEVQVQADAASEAIDDGFTSALYRVAQEAVNNAVRHGHPSRVTLAVGVHNGVARLEVSDDGVGFDIAEAEDRRSGMGLFAMRERAALVGGGVEIRSDATTGTRVIVTIPLTGVVGQNAQSVKPPLVGSTRARSSET
ncbi:MAG: sensor histidine kinase [Gemmatimonadaceae bacterium]